MSKTFKIRKFAPTAWNKLYNNKNNGGLSWCINGKPTNSVANVLANCVGYACSRFNEIYNEVSGYKNMKYPQLCCNAENFWEKAKEIGLKRGQTPKAGAIMCWEGIGSLAGHVAIVEKVNSKTKVYTSESGYNSAYFWNATRTKGTGNWGANGNYRFKGFIYNPALEEEKTTSTTAKKETTTKKTPTKATAIKVGDTVEVTNPITYTGQKFYLFFTNYTVMELNGARAVIGKNGVVTAAINVKYLKKVSK